MVFSVEGKKVIITGSSGGIGSALVGGFKREGANVIPFDIGNSHPFFRNVNVLINCAGISNSNKSEEMFEVNFWQAARFCFAFIQQSKRSGGSIINITSLGAELALPDNPIYNSSKAALAQLTRSIALDYGKYGIRANNVCPGYIQTPMTAKSYADPTERKKRTDRTMLGRWGKPEDIVGACIFLASDASSYITGSTIYVDGGWTARGL